MTKRELSKLIRYWQPILGLRDWTIELTVVPKMDGAEATCLPVVETKTAHIEVVRTSKDPEQAIVHELLHCLFDPFYVQNNRAKRIIQEQVVDALATALVRVKRG